jgi:transglutaminase-like putative cysteine protease
MGALIWLLAYLAAWTLFRRGWLFASILLPGFLLLVNLGYAPDPESGPIVIYLLGSGILAARYHLFRRQQQWARWGMPSPAAMSSRFFATGAVVAVVAVGIGWSTPQSLAHASLEPLLSRFQEPLLDAQERLLGWAEGSGSDSDDALGEESGRFSSFGDSFSIGGPLRLTDAPAVLLQAETPAYLVGHHYDAYSGTGWRSTVESTFDGRGADGQTYSPEMTFQAGQKIPLSPAVQRERNAVNGAITLLAPRGDVLLTTDTYVTANLPTSVRLSWRRIENERYEIDVRAIGELPPDLQRIAILLARGDFAPGAAQNTFPDDDPLLAAEIQTEQAELSRRFLTVGWEIDAEGRATNLLVSGQLPVYDDVEAVFARDSVQPNAAYAVTGLTSVAAPDQLRQAGDEYPDHVEQRYFQLPDTITPRTVELARNITRETDNPFDAAKAIESYLRENIAYAEDVPIPPSNQDIVDYVLFDDRRGYCEYYAAAMAVLLRTQDIPARVVVGFYPGQYDEARGGFLYRERNAHAWVEVYFPDYGWIPFEPTASQPTREYGADAVPATVESTPPLQTPATAETSPPLATDVPSTPAAALPAIVTPPEDSQRRDQLIAGALVLGALLALGVAAWAIWLRPLRGLSPGDALYARLLRFGRFVGLRTDDVTTPHEFARSLGEAVPATRRPAMQIVEVYEVNRYGRDGADASLVRAARQGWSELRRQLVPARLQMRRWRRDHDHD